MTAKAPGDVRLQLLVLGRRLEAFAIGSSWAFVPAFAAIAVLLAMHISDGMGDALAVWAAVAFLALCARILVGARVTPRADDVTVLQRQWRAINFVLMLGSLAWAVGLPLAAWLSASSAAYSASAIVGATLLGSVLLMHRTAPRAAMVHVVAIGFGLALAEWLRAGWQSWPVLALITACAIMLIHAIRVQERSFQATARAELDRRESEHTIRMLLDEHEAQATDVLCAIDSDGALHSDGRTTGIGRDVTDRPPIEERVRAMAHIDPLTGLANRNLFNRRLRAVLGENGSDAKPAALLYLDLDDFKAVNDTQGFLFGEGVLREMGARLRRASREGDLVARLGGDEFAVLVESPGGDGLLIERAHRLLAVAREPFRIDGQSLSLSTSVGIARANGECSAAELMRRADLALYAAKAKGRDQLAIFDEGLDRLARENRSLELGLREAVDRGEMRLLYQPIIALQTGASVGYEGLLRWQHPERGMLMPADFLPIAEETGLIVPLGDWVIRHALAEVADWPGQFRLSLKLSPTQMRSTQLIATVDAALAGSGIAAHRLEFATTEPALDDAAAGCVMLDRLRALGAGIALGDLGTGLSSLGSLRDYRFDRVKIERSFVNDIETSDEAQAIVSAITRLAQALGIRTTAQGAERPGQLDLLRKLGCDEAQGFLTLEPVEARAIEEARARGLDLPSLSSDLEDYRQARRAAS